MSDSSTRGRLMKRLKVIALQRGRDVETLEPNYVVAFGKYMAVTDEMGTRAKSLG